MYAGLDVDYENVAPRDRALFTRFVTELGAALHARGKTLSVTVMPKTRDNVRTGPSAAMDYAAIGRVADQVRVMAYDYHWRCGRSGPIAPLPWVESVVRYSASRIEPSKLVLGVPFYAYRWPVRGCGAARTWQQVARERRNPRAKNGFSKVWATAMLRVGRHTTWYEDARSIRAKAMIAQRYGLAGVYAWRFGEEDPAIFRSSSPPPVRSPRVPRRTAGSRWPCCRWRWPSTVMTTAPASAWGRRSRRWTTRLRRAGCSARFPRRTRGGAGGR